MRVVVVGASGNSGTSLLTTLARDPQVSSILGVARRPPALEWPKTDWARADIARDDSCRSSVKPTRSFIWLVDSALA